MASLMTHVLVSGLESVCSHICRSQRVPLPEGPPISFVSHTSSATYTTLIYLFRTRRPTRDNKMLPSQIGLHEPGYIFRVQHSPPPTP